MGYTTRPKTRVRVTFAAVLAATAVLVAGCGSGDTEPKGASDAFNDADVTFAQSMIPHHEQALVMARMAQSHGSDPRVQQLAADIEAAQDPEIEQMTGWLKAWGEDVPDADTGMGGMDGMDGMDTSDMPGMMDEDAMDGLDQASGPAWDQMFLTMMTEHHQGAIEMARSEQNDGQNADAIALAARIESAQLAEIETMQGLLAP